MKKYEEPIMEVINLKTENVFTLYVSNESDEIIGGGGWTGSGQ